MPRAVRGSRRDRALLAVFAVVLTAALSWQNGLGRVDDALYDAMAMVMAPAAAPDIMIVAVDEASLGAVGRWPWDRHVHADLIERIGAGAPAAIALDVLLPEPSLDAGADAALAGAIKRSGRVALPMFAGAAEGLGVRGVLPLPIFVDAGAALGHVAIAPFEDGVVREVALRAGKPQALYDHLSITLLRLAGRMPLIVPGERRPADESAGADGWQQDHLLRIAFPRSSRPHAQVSAHAILAGDIDPAIFRDRIVLIGITAAGLGDTYPTPLTRDSLYAPGVAILAAALDNVAHGPQWRAASAIQTLVFSLVAVALLLGALMRNTPSGALATTVIFCIEVVLASLALLWAAGVWVPPGAALIVGLIAYPLWSWRRLEAASAYMADELRRLQREEAILPVQQDEPMPHGDLVAKRIDAMARATSHLRALNAFIEAAIEGLPDITLVGDRHGRIVLANRAAALYFRHQRPEQLRGLPLVRVLQALHARDGSKLALTPGRDVECRDTQGQEFLLKYTECRGLPEFATIGIVSLIDVAPLRQAERARDEALRFLSHDLRAPLSAIQAIVALPAHDEAPDREQRIGRLAGQAQALAESFLQLARAESAPMRRSALDLVDVALDAIDACWAEEQARGAVIAFDPPQAAPAQGDRDMLTRAVVNLLTNALKYGPTGQRITVSLVTSGVMWRLAVQDHGPGIDPSLQATLFAPFVRADGATAPGVGLGLAYVRAVAARHGGEVVLDSAVGQGSTFTLVLPIDTSC